VDELWTCDDGKARSRFHLTPIDLHALTLEADAAASCVLAGMKLDRHELDFLAVRIGRAAELVRGHRFMGPLPIDASERARPHVPLLVSVLRASDRLLDAIATRQHFTHSALPILIANLHMAGALARAELAGVVRLLLLLGKENKGDESQG